MIKSAAKKSGSNVADRGSGGGERSGATEENGDERNGSGEQDLGHEAGLLSLARVCPQLPLPGPQRSGDAIPN